MAETNLSVLKPSRKALKPGDVFALRMPDGRYGFGRVIRTDAEIGPMTGCVLIYVYRVRSDTMEVPDRAELSPDRLLIPPVMTNKLPWSRGYFEVIANLPTGPGEELAQHCFLSAARGTYFDEFGHQLPGPVEPVGDYALHSYRTLDDQISDALGVARVP